MERRLYFLIGDLLSNVGVGALVGLAVALFVNGAWPVVLAMIIGMLVGDLIALPVAFALSALFGAMELMLPVMLTGMIAGMLVGMWAAMMPLSGGSTAVLGGVVGLMVLVVTYALNAYVRAGGLTAKEPRAGC
jgi:hypothetical protein